jgi:hypothetical protein
MAVHVALFEVLSTQPVRFVWPASSTLYIMDPSMPGGIPFYKRMGLGKYRTWKHGHPNSPKRPCLIRTFWHVVSDRVLSSPFHQPPRGAFSKHPYIDTNGCCVVAAAKNMRRSDTAAVPFPIVFEGAIIIARICIFAKWVDAA